MRLAEDMMLTLAGIARIDEIRGSVGLPPLSRGEDVNKPIYAGGFPTHAWRIPFTRRIVKWYGWRTTIGDLADRLGLFSEHVCWTIKGRLWNWCWKTDFDWRDAQAQARDRK